MNMLYYIFVNLFLQMNKSFCTFANLSFKLSSNAVSSEQIEGKEGLNLSEILTPLP